MNTIRGARNYCFDPWLFDLQEDPDELANVYTDPSNRKIAEQMKAELIDQKEKYNEPVLQKGKLIYGE